MNRTGLRNIRQSNIHAQKFQNRRPIVTKHCNYALYVKVGFVLWSPSACFGTSESTPQHMNKLFSCRLKKGNRDNLLISIMKSDISMVRECTLSVPRTSGTWKPDTYLGRCLTSTSLHIGCSAKVSQNSQASKATFSSWSWVLCSMYCEGNHTTHHFILESK